MSTTFHALPPTIWRRSFRELTTEAKVVAFYVWSCTSRSSEGLFLLPIGHVVTDTGIDLAQVETAFDELSKADLIRYDIETEVVLDRLALQTMPIRSASDNRIKAAVRRFETVPRTPLRSEFVRLADEHAPALADEIRTVADPFDFPPPSTPNEPPSKDLPRTSEGGSKDLDGGPLRRTFQGPPKDRVELSREEESREELRNTQEVDESQGPGCSWCGQPAMIKAGEVQVGPSDLPWCGWCEPEAMPA